MPDPTNQVVVDAITAFSWHNYGLDEVSEAESDDYAAALADDVLEALSQHFDEPRSRTPELDRVAAHARAYQEQAQMWQARYETAAAEIGRLRETSKRFTDPKVTDAVEREIRKMPIDPSTCSTGCTVQYGPCARHIAEHLVDALREERLVVLTTGAADEIVRAASDGTPEEVA